MLTTPTLCVHMVIYSSIEIPIDKHMDYRKEGVMKKVFQTWVAAVLAVAILAAVGVPAYAAENMPISQENSLNPYSCTIEIEDGHMFYQLTETQSISVLTGIEANVIEINISNLSQEGTVYQLMRYDYDVPEKPTQKFWNDMIEYGNANLTNAHVYTVVSTSYTESEKIAPAAGHASAGADLRGDLEDLVGREYAGNTLYMTTKNGNTVRVVESMSFYVTLNRQFAWRDALTISALIASVLGLFIAAPLVAAIGCVLVIASSAASMLPVGGSLNQYTCRVGYSRSGTVNGSSYSYSNAEKFLYYNGFEDADLNSTERAYLDTTLQSTVYSNDGSGAYYNDLPGLADAAYAEFLVIGQQP